MRDNQPKDLFAGTSRPQDRMSVREASDAMTHARNASLSQPIAYLQTKKDIFTHDGIPLFERVNPIQAVHFFLEQISHSMVFSQPVTIDEMALELAAHLRLLAGESGMSLELSEVAAARIVSALRNEQHGYDWFRETLRNPLTLEVDEYLFRLIAMETVRVGNEDVVVYRLTREGVKLLHLNNTAIDDFDVFSVIVASLVKNGRYSAALGHVVNCRDKSVEIESQLGDILRSLNQYSYEPHFSGQIVSLISDVTQQTEAFIKTYNDFQRLFEVTADADLDPVQKSEIRQIKAEILRIHDIQARLSLKLSECSRLHRRLIDRRAENSGVASSIPDITNDFLMRLAGMSVNDVANIGLADAFLAPLLGPAMDGILDPFLVLDKAKADRPDDHLSEEEEAGSAIETREARYSLSDLKATDDFIRAVMRRFGKEGVSIEQFYLLASQNDMPLSVRQRILHQVALLPSVFGGRVIEKHPTGGRVDNEFLSGPNLILRYASAT